MDRHPPSSRVHGTFGAGLLLVVAVAAVFAGSVRVPFVFDDVHAILLNPHLERLWPPDAALWAAEQSPLSGRPVAAFTFAVDFALGGISPYGYHVVNVALHALTACMLLGLLRRVLARDGGRPAGGSAADDGTAGGRAARTGLAFAVVLLWSLHPLQSEAVTYVVQRTELLSAAFLVGCLLAAVRGMAAERRAGWFALSVACAVLGVASKETVVAAPVLVLLVDRHVGRRTFREALRRHRALYVGLASSWVLLAALVATGPRDDSVGLHLGVSSWTWLLTQSEVLAHYLRLSLWPAPLTLSYGWPLAEGLSDVLPSALLVVGLLAVSVAGVVRDTRWGLAGAWFFVLLAPTSSVVPIVTEVAAERRMYLPLLAVVAVVVVALDALVRRTARVAREGAVPVRTVAPVVGVVALAGVASWGTVERIDDWRDPVALWRDAAATRPDNRTAHFMLGNALKREERFEEALASYERALALDPHDFQVLQNQGNTLLAMHRFEEAVAVHRRAVALHPGVAVAHFNLAITLLNAGHPEEAAGQLERCVELEPDVTQHRLLLASLLAGLGRVDEARAGLEAAIARGSGDPALRRMLDELDAEPPAAR